MSNHEIAESRGLDIRTLGTYWSALTKSMGVDSLADAVALLRPELSRMDPDLLTRQRRGTAKGDNRRLSAKESGALAAHLEAGDSDKAARMLRITRSCFSSRLCRAQAKLG
jgi:hypothetical protein